MQNRPNKMRFQYPKPEPPQSEFDSLPRLPLRLHLGGKLLDVVGLIDSGATVNVLPYQTGLQLGEKWSNRKAVIPLRGTLGKLNGIPVFPTAQIGDFAPVRLAFVWVKNDQIPLVLGQTNFLMLFNVCFYRSKFEFEISPISK